MPFGATYKADDDAVALLQALPHIFRFRHSHGNAEIIRRNAEWCAQNRERRKLRRVAREEAIATGADVREIVRAWTGNRPTVAH